MRLLQILLFLHIATAQTLEQLDAWDKAIGPATVDPEVALEVEFFIEWDHPQVSGQKCVWLKCRSGPTQYLMLLIDSIVQADFLWR